MMNAGTFGNVARITTSSESYCGRFEVAYWIKKQSSRTRLASNHLFREQFFNREHIPNHAVGFEPRTVRLACITEHGNI